MIKPAWFIEFLAQRAIVWLKMITQIHYITLTLYRCHENQLTCKDEFPFRWTEAIHVWQPTAHT